MHCWKSFNADNKYHFYRRFIISSMIALLVFMALYVPLQSVVSRPLQDTYFLVFLSVLIILYPLHKFCHLLPIFNQYKSIKVKVNVYFYFLPILDIKVEKPIPKLRFIVTLLFPFFTINLLLLGAAFMMPQYVHYATILLAYHIGICAVDLFYAKAVISAPKGALVEENEDGYEILVN